MSDVEAPVRDERLVEQLTTIDDICRDQGVDASPVFPLVEDVLTAGNVLRDAAVDAGMNGRSRRVVADALGRALRTGAD